MKVVFYKWKRDLKLTLLLTLLFMNQILLKQNNIHASTTIIFPAKFMIPRPNGKVHSAPESAGNCALQTHKTSVNNIQYSNYSNSV